MEKTEVSEIISTVLEQLQPHSPWMSVKQTANYLKLGETKVRQLIRAGEIPHKRIDGSIRVHRKMLDQSILLDRNVDLKAPTQRESKRLKKLLN